MRVGAFELNEPLPDLEKPHAIAMLRPWIDAGNVATLTMGWLEKEAHAKPLGELWRPGSYLDFTRYRPIIYNSGDERNAASIGRARR